MEPNTAAFSTSDSVPNVLLLPRCHDLLYHCACSFHVFIAQPLRVNVTVRCTYCVNTCPCRSYITFVLETACFSEAE